LLVGRLSARGGEKVTKSHVETRYGYVTALLVVHALNSELPLRPRVLELPDDLR
jgi:hypothetical protein